MPTGVACSVRGCGDCNRRYSPTVRRPAQAAASAWAIAWVSPLRYTAYDFGDEVGESSGKSEKGSDRGGLGDCRGLQRGHEIAGARQLIRLPGGLLQEGDEGASDDDPIRNLCHHAHLLRG